jgi:hypothetical protein
MLSSVFRRLSENGLHTGLNERPSSSIEGLLLSPDNLLNIGVFLQLIAELGEGEGVELFDTSDGDVIDVVGGTVLVKGGVNLAGTDEETLALFGGLERFAVLGIRDEPLEVGVAGEVFNV